MNEPTPIPRERCPDCGGFDPYPHNLGCLTLARCQREQLRWWRASGGHPDPARWGAREAEIERLLTRGWWTCPQCAASVEHGVQHACDQTVRLATGIAGPPQKP